MISIIRRKKRAVKGKTKKIKPKNAIGSPGCVCCFCAQGFCTAAPRGARGPGNSTAQPPARRRAAGVRHCVPGGKRPGRLHGAAPGCAMPSLPRAPAAVRQRGPRAPHRPPARLARQPALPFCPSRAGPAGRTRGETYLPLSGRGARLIFWLQGPQNPRPQALR